MRELYERARAGRAGPRALHLLHEGAIIARSVGGQADALDNARAAARDLVMPAAAVIIAV